MLDALGNVVPEPDGFVDIWCDDITDVSTCPHGLAPTVGLPSANRMAMSRVVAVEVNLVTRTRTYNPRLDPGGGHKPSNWPTLGTTIDVLNHTVTGKRDGYRRWVYRAVVQLRNNQLKP